MIGERLTQLRLAQNLTLDALAEKIGGIVTKQALSKYERNLAQPSPIVLARLSAALGVKAGYLLSPSSITVEFIAFRKLTSLPEREKARIRSVVMQCLEDRVKVQTLIGQGKPGFLPWNQLSISSLEDTERHADEIRKLWELGASPISSVVATLEEHQLCVLSIEANEKFDGISALGRDTSGNVLAGVLVTRRGVSGERQRLNLTHELGHSVLRVPSSINEEQAAFRFASALLVPAERLIRAVGARRSYVHISELLILKKQFGISVQALLRRMHDLGIINDSYYRRWFVYIGKQGWKKQEPDELPAEAPQWLERNLSRLVGEGAIGQEEAERMLGVSIDVQQPHSIVQRRAFLGLPMEQRRKRLVEQARLLSGYYEKEAEFLTTGEEVDDY